MSIDTSSRDRAVPPILRILFSALAVMVLSGCAVLINPTTIASAVADGISYATTGKGSADHLISGLTDQDCAMHRGFTDKPVCNPPMPLGALRFEVENWALHNTIRLDFGKAEEILDFEDGPERRTVTLEPDGWDRRRGGGSERIYVYRLLVSSANGSIETWTRTYPRPRCTAFAYNETSEESFFLGASLKLLGDVAALERDVFALEWGEIEVPAEVESGESFEILTEVSNRSDHRWEQAAASRVNLSYHWLDAEGRPVVWEGLRTRLSSAVEPGGRVRLWQEIEAPEAAGDYILALDLVFEYVSWFSERNGVKTYRRSVTVRESPAP